MQYSSLESLALPRRQRVFDTQLVPAGDALPLWTTLPLDSKLPVVPCPKGSYTLYTTPMGKPKYIHKQHYDFDLNHSLYARPGEYDSLHDPFLKQYFVKPRTKRLLVNNDLITRDGKVKCDIKEFNNYRSYLRYRSVTELSLQRSGDSDQSRDSWLPAPTRLTKSETPRTGLNSQIASERDNDSMDPLALYGRDVSLVQRMRIREKTLLKRMTEKEREREREHDTRIKESWQSRKQRQKRVLKYEDEVDRKLREERGRLIVQRERTLARQRDHMMAKIKGSTKAGEKKKTDKKRAEDTRREEERRGSPGEKQEEEEEEEEEKEEEEAEGKDADNA